MILPPSIRTGGRSGGRVGPSGTPAWTSAPRVVRGVLQEHGQRLGVGDEVGGQHGHRLRGGAGDLGDAAQVGAEAAAGGDHLHVADGQAASWPVIRSSSVPSAQDSRQAGVVASRTTDVVVLTRVSESGKAQVSSRSQRECVDSAVATGHRDITEPDRYARQYEFSAALRRGGPGGRRWSACRRSTPPSSSSNRRQDDPGAHARPVRRLARDRRGRRADDARASPSTVKEIVREGGFHKVGQIVEGGASRHREHLAGAAGAGPAGVQRAAARRCTPPPGAPDHHGVCTGAADGIRPWRWRSRAPTPSWWPPPGRTAEIIRDVPDRSRLRRAQTPQCFRLSVIRRGVRAGVRRPRLRPAGRPPTTAAWCCATCPRCRSTSCRAASRT